MLVPAMNEIEIYKEIIEDGMSVLKTITTKVRLQTMVMKRTNNWNWVETVHIKTARNNQWSVYMNVSHGSVATNMYVITEGEYGITAYNFFMLKDIPFLLKYTPHFFKRYRERMELKDMAPRFVVKQFFRNNINLTPVYSDADETGAMMAAISLPQGMGYGKFSGKSPMTEMKTFIPTSMLNKGQSQLAGELNDDDSYREDISFIGR